MDKQREKLIELLKKADPDCYATRSCDGCFYSKQGACDIHYIADQILADEEIKHAFELLKAEKEGRLIVPPCKVGETLYFLYDNTFANRPNSTPFLYETNDWYFDIDPKGISILPRSIHSYKGKHHYYLGKTVFLSREEAEKALKEGEL